MPRSLRLVLIKTKQKEYNILRTIFEKETGTTECYLLRLDGDTLAYQETIQLTDNFYWEYSKFRQRMELQYATLPADEAAFKFALKQSSHFSINGTIYLIEDADVVDPQGEEPYWLIPGIRATGVEYVSP